MKTSIILTSHIGMLSLSSYLSLNRSGFNSIILFINIKCKKKANLIKALNEYGLFYVADRLLFRVANFIWIKLNRKRIAGMKIVEINELDWDYIEELSHSVNASIVVSASLKHKIPLRYLKNIKNVLNIHPGPLPEWRGPDPVYWMMKLGEREFGITLHEVSTEFDTGDIFYVYKIDSRFKKLRLFIDVKIASAIQQNLGTWSDNIFLGSVAKYSQKSGNYWPMPTTYNIKKFSSRLDKRQ